MKKKEKKSLKVKTHVKAGEYYSWAEQPRRERDNED